MWWFNQYILAGEIGHCGVPTKLHHCAEAFGTGGHHEVLMRVHQRYLMHVSLEEPHIISAIRDWKSSYIFPKD